LFEDLDPTELSSVINTMLPIEKVAGEVIIQQGDDGTECYVLEHGTADVFVGENCVSHLISTKHPPLFSLLILPLGPPL